MVSNRQPGGPFGRDDLDRDHPDLSAEIAEIDGVTINGPDELASELGSYIVEGLEGGFDGLENEVRQTLDEALRGKQGALKPYYRFAEDVVDVMNNPNPAGRVTNLKSQMPRLGVEAWKQGVDLIDYVILYTHQATYGKLPADMFEVVHGVLQNVASDNGLDYNALNNPLADIV